MNQSTDNRPDIAREHLTLLKESHAKMDREDRYYVGLAFTYGLTVDEIVKKSGLTVARVREVLAQDVPY